MNKLLDGYWNEFKGEAQKNWGKLTGSELDQVQGEVTKLVGLIQQKYGKTIEEAQKEVAKWQAEHNKLHYQGEWDEFKAKAQAKWTDLTGKEIDEVKNSKAQLAGKIQAMYNKSASEALKEVNNFLDKIS